MRNGRRILLVCKETYSYPLYYIAQKWKKDHEVAAFFFVPSETMLNKCQLNDTTYYNFKSDTDIRMFTSDKIADLFTRHLKNPPIDFAFLANVEQNYTYYRSLNCQIMSSQFFSSYYHYRTHMYPATYEQQMYWLELNYKNILKIVKEFAPDYVVDTDTAELGRLVLMEVCHKKGIPYLTIEHPRYEMYREVTHTLGLKNDTYFVEGYKKNQKLPDSRLSEELKYIEDYNVKSRIMPKEFKTDITAQYEPDSLLLTLRKIHGCIHYFIVDQDLRAHNRKLKGKNPVLYNNSFAYIKFFLRYTWNRNRLLRNNRIFQKPVKGENYVYMPLHMIPEATTFVKAPFFINELALIEEVSKALPIGWYLYVKEHQSMVGERGLDFYKKVNKIPNVRLVQLNYYKDPKPWIIHAKGVVTISGTTAYEAALLGKPALVFGEVLFHLIDGITKVENLEQLPKLLQEFDGYQGNRHSCAAYIKTVKEYGEQIDMIKLERDGLDIIRRQQVPPNDYMDEIDKLERLFLRHME